VDVLVTDAPAVGAVRDALNEADVQVEVAEGS
jgi:hypothetical protein